MKFRDYFKESREETERLKGLIAKVAQKEYDAWTPEEEGGEDEWGGGGICHTIADSIVGVLSELGIDALSMQASVGENHTFVIALMKDGIYNIDVPPDVYEIGSGYNWTKKPGVVISSSDVIIDLITRDVSKWDEYNNDMNESSGKTLISVDIQPEYYYKKTRVGGFKDDILNGLIQALNGDDYNKKIILYNGAETLGMISESDYKMWLLENGLEEDKLDECRFYDKGYAFFRFCLDSGIAEEDIVKLVKFMGKHNINDSRQIKESELWDEFMQEYDLPELRELLEDAGDCIHIPDLMDWLSSRARGQIDLIGGGANECLKEVEIALQAMGIDYNKNEGLIYEAPMFHGTNVKFDKPKEGKIHWVTPSKEFAQEYASGAVVHRNGGEPIVYEHDIDVKHPATTKTDYTSILHLLNDWVIDRPNKNVDMKQLGELKSAIIKEWFKVGLDNSETATHNHWNLSGAIGNKLLIDFLEFLGYDGIYYKEQDHDTYGVWKL